jgi:(R,R)-butanediol dehydrogenase/meso-butanediol dehydrogenase/diacetyl reductase
VRLPATLSLADGALIEPLASALRGVGMASIRHGDRVLVLGAGAIGAGAIYWARRLGAGRIVATARSARRAPLALDMGATAFLDSAALDAGLLEALGGAPDIVLECTGAPGMLAKAVELVRTGGTIVCAGICPVADTFFPALAVAKELSLRFSCAYDYGDFRYAVDSLDRGAIEPRAMIDHNIGLDAVPEVLESMRAGHSYGTKTLVDPNRLAL